MHFMIDIDTKKRWRNMRVILCEADGSPFDITYMFRAPIFGMALRLRRRMRRMKRRYMKIKRALEMKI